MRIVEEKYNIRCDIPLCHNKSDYTIEVSDSKRHNLHICKACLNELYMLMGKIKTPKSVENVVKRAEIRRNEWNKNK